MWLEVSPEHVLEVKGTLCLEHSLERFPAAGDMLRGGARTSETMSKPFLYNLAGRPGLCPCHRHFGHSFGLCVAEEGTLSPTTDPGRATCKWVTWGGRGAQH